MGQFDTVLVDIAHDESSAPASVSTAIGAEEVLMPLLTPPLSPHARRAVQLANYEAKRLKCPHVAPEHLMLGICNARPLLIADILQRANVDLARVRLQVQRLTLGSACLLVKDVLPKLPESEQAIYDACALAREFRHSEVGAEHLLLSLLQDRAGTAATALKNLRIDVQELCHELRRRFVAAGAGAFDAPPLAQVVPGSERIICYGHGRPRLRGRIRAMFFSPAIAGPLLAFLLAMAIGAWLRT